MTAGRPRAKVCSRCKKVKLSWPKDSCYCKPCKRIWESIWRYRRAQAIGDITEDRMEEKIAALLKKDLK